MQHCPTISQRSPCDVQVRATSRKLPGAQRLFQRRLRFSAVSERLGYAELSFLSYVLPNQILPRLRDCRRRSTSGLRRRWPARCPTATPTILTWVLHREVGENEAEATKVTVISASEHVQTRVFLVLVISEVPVAPASIACQMLGPSRPGEWNAPCNNSLRRLLGVSISQECSSLPVGSKSLAKQRGAWDMRSGCDSDALADRCACADVDSCALADRVL